MGANKRYKTLGLVRLCKHIASHKCLYRGIQTQSLLPNISYRKT